METKKIIVGVIVAQILWFILFGIFNAYITESILCSAIAWIYLLCVYLQKRMSEYWITVNRWLIPILVAFCIMQLPLYIIFLLKGKGILFLLFPLYVYRFTLILELPLIAYICCKMDKRISKLSSKGRFNF